MLHLENSRLIIWLARSYNGSVESEYSEHELEMQLVNNIRAFLIEMGGDFTFIGNQYHMVVGSRDLYIDLSPFPFFVINTGPR